MASGIVQRAKRTVWRTPGLRAAAMLSLHAAGARNLRRPPPAPSPLQLISDERDPPPSMAAPVSQLCTAAQFREPTYRRWTDAFRAPVRLHRKQWEFVYILQALSQRGMLAPDREGVGFGCGLEPLPAVFADRGAAVLVTDLDLERARSIGWVESQEHVSNLAQLNRNEICARAKFSRLVRFAPCDMNAIPESYIGQFDFCWSACSLEHLGSLRHGVDFIINSTKCLKPGGVAVHTTEFNLSSNDDTLEEPGCSVYRRRDIEALSTELAANGCELAPLTFNAGREPVDRYVDVPPYSSAAPHLRLQLASYAVTSIGLTVTRLRR